MHTPQNKVSTDDKFQKKCRAACFPFALCTVSTSLKFYLNIFLTSYRIKTLLKFQKLLDLLKNMFFLVLSYEDSFLRSCQGNWNPLEFWKKLKNWPINGMKNLNDIFEKNAQFRRVYRLNLSLFFYQKFHEQNIYSYLKAGFESLSDDYNLYFSGITHKIYCNGKSYRGCHL